MADEINPNVTYEKTFISPINEDISSTEHSSSTQHIEETQQRRFSSENINNDSHIEATQNGDHQTTQNGDHIQHSTDQTTENQTQFIQETIPNDQESTSPSHIQPINTTDDEILQHSSDQQDSSQTFLEQSNSSDYHDQSNINHNQDDSNFIDNNNQSNINHNQDDSNLLFVDDQTSNTDTNSFTLMDLHDKPDQLKAQRELDDDEIPPAEIPTDETPKINELNNSTKESETNIINNHPSTELATPSEHHHEDQSSTDNQTNNTTTESDTSLNDSRPLTALETPYEHHHEETNLNDTHPSTELEPPYEHDHKNKNPPIEILLNQNMETNVTDNHHLTEDETSYEDQNKNEINNFSLSSSLPDVVTETIELEKSLIEETPVQNEVHFTKEDFPPLPPTSISIEQALHAEPNHLYTEHPVLSNSEVHLTENDFPPLPPTSIALEQTLHTESNHLNKEEQHQHPLFSKSEPIISEPEDILGNKTLIKQTTVKGINDTHPTRSTMVTVSYTLSLVDNLTSNVRLIENVSNERFFVSEHDTIPAIDISVQKMNRGEHAVIDADIRLGYGDIGCEEKQIPPTTSLNPYRMKIDLELHDWKSALDVQTLSIEDRLQWGEKKRQMGNFYYRRQDYPISLQCYHGALRFLDTDNNPLLASCDENQRLILNDHYITVQNNVAQVNLHLDKYDACLHAVENVLKHDPKNVKALFRQGKALFKLGTYDKAIQPLKLLAQIQRGNSTPDLEKDKVNEMISVCENKLANYQKNEKEIYRRMFQPPPPTTTSTLNQQRQTKNKNQIDNTNNNWWPYIALGSAVLATVGFVTFIKYRKNS